MEILKKKGMKKMLGNFNVILLSANENQKKNSTDKYYTMSFLDENDNSFNCYINKDVYSKIKELGFKRFSEIVISLSIYKEKDSPHYNFNVKDIIPFIDKK